MLSRNELQRTIRYEGGVSRRWFLAYAGALSSIPLLGRAAWANPKPVLVTSIV